MKYITTNDRCTNTINFHQSKTIISIHMWICVQIICIPSAIYLRQKQRLLPNRAYLLILPLHLFVYTLNNSNIGYITINTYTIRCAEEHIYQKSYQILQTPTRPFVQRAPVAWFRLPQYTCLT